MATALFPHSKPSCFYAMADTWPGGHFYSEETGRLAWRISKLGSPKAMWRTPGSFTPLELTVAFSKKEESHLIPKLVLSHGEVPATLVTE